MTEKIVIGIPTAGSTQPESLTSIWLQAFHLGKLQEQRDHNGVPKFEFFFKPAGRLYTPMAREKILEDALNLEADYLMMVDDDMVFQADLFEKLYRHKVDIVAPLAFTRNPPHLPVMYQTKEGWDPISHRPYYITEWIKNYPKDRLVEVDAVGFGAVLINLDIARKMTQPRFMSSTGTGEDITFCINAKKVGARIFTDTSTIIGHLSNPMIIDETSFEKFNDKKAMETFYGPYTKYGVREVCMFKEEEVSKEPVVLGK